MEGLLVMMNPGGWIRRVKRDERGAGIVTALMITLIIFALGATWTQIGIHQVEGSSFERHREQALNSAEAGVNQAISTLSAQYDWSGTTEPVALPDGSGEYEIEVTPVDPNDPDDLDRYIVARSYSPYKGAPRVATRQVEQQVTLDPIDGFSHALFASPGGLVGDNNSTITGDVYSASDLTLAQSAKVFGDLTAAGNITTHNNSTIGGNVWAGKAATIDNSQTTVEGDVWSGSNAGEGVALTGAVLGDVQTGGTVTGGGTVSGTTSENNPPPPPPTLTQPTFTWDPNNYLSATSWTSASNFMAHWSDNTGAFSGHHYIGGGDSSSNKITLDKKWTMTGDVTLVAEGPITLARDVVNGTSDELVLTVISSSDRAPAIEFTNNVTIPADIKILLYAPNGLIDFSQLKDFHGVVYGESINLSQQFTLAYDPPEVPGFDWGASSATHFDVDVSVFREVPFDPPA